jgi:hypothetical protein
MLGWKLKGRANRCLLQRCLNSAAENCNGTIEQMVLSVTEGILFADNSYHLELCDGITAPAGQQPALVLDFSGADCFLKPDHS